MNNETTQNQEQSKGNLDSKVSIDDLGGSAKEQIDSLYKYINNMKTDVELMQNLNPVDYIKTYIANGKGNLSFDVIGKSGFKPCV
ncbi:hypothetical protein B0I53_001789 [Clostridium saccharobutylicum]|nr:hypothetical protein [Clostridium saccharobutylicum]